MTSPIFKVLPIFQGSVKATLNKEPPQSLQLTVSFPFSSFPQNFLHTSLITNNFILKFQFFFPFLNSRLLQDKINF